jgi:glycosyltransferase involved in cell wall biosynthesis
MARSIAAPPRGRVAVFPMRIAQVSPLYEAVPPKLYGGTERVVSYLTEELVRLGHRVTLFASGDSVTRAELEACARRSLRLDSSVRDPLAHHILQLERVRRRAKEFDILHFHTDYLSFPLLRELGVPSLTTLHGRLDQPDLQPLYDEFDDVALASISKAQQRPLPQANWVGAVHHGLPADLLPFQPFPRGDYLAFLGRISPEKRPDRAIAIARLAGLPLKIAAKIDRADEAYFHAEIAPLLDDPLVRFVGEVDEAGKAEFLGHARALLFPVDWPEPFGLAMIEAIACGAPVIAWPCGAVPEIVEDGVTGFLVDSVEAAAAAVGRAASLPRRRIRQRFEQRFLARRMALDYLAIYGALRCAAPLPAAGG